MESGQCACPECDQTSIGHCAWCKEHFCTRHIWQAEYQTLVVLCYACHQRLADAERKVRWADAADWAIVVVLLFIASGISYSLHYLRHMDPTLTKWMFWICLVGFVLTLGWLTLQVATLYAGRTRRTPTG